MKLSRMLLLALLIAGVGACGEAAEVDSAESDLCAQAQAKLAECFPDETPGDMCHGATAQRVLDDSCEELANVDTKADGNWMCFWNPFLCASSGGSTSQPSTYTLMVGTSRCGGGLLGDDCTYYQSSSCTAVALYRDGAEVARDHSSRHGSVRFEVSEAGTYEVRVLDRADEVTDQIKGFVSYSYVPAVESVTLDDKREVRVNFNLPSNSEEAVKRCAPFRIDLTVESPDEVRIHPHEVEWDWFIRFEQENGTVGVSRPFSFHPDATREPDYVNRTTFHWTYAGDHTVEFIRMNVPQFRRVANPDYEALLERYAVKSVGSHVEPYTMEHHNIPEGDMLRIVLIDPLAN